MRKALILVDIQHDFLPGGALGVPDGDAVIPVAIKAMKHFHVVVATQDWHPRNHGSFASNHPGMKPGEMIELGGQPQVLWPDHCVQGSRGAEIHSDIDLNGVTIFRKGTDPLIDSYSAFFDNAHNRSTGLGDFLNEHKISDACILGLATDYCVKFSALDALKLGFAVWMIQDGCRGVNLSSDDSTKAIEEMRTAGVKIIQSGDL